MDCPDTTTQTKLANTVTKKKKTIKIKKDTKKQNLVKRLTKHNDTPY